MQLNIFILNIISWLIYAKFWLDFRWLMIRFVTFYIHIIYSLNLSFSKMKWRIWLKAALILFTSPPYAILQVNCFIDSYTLKNIKILRKKSQQRNTTTTEGWKEAVEFLIYLHTQCTWWMAFFPTWLCYIATMCNSQPRKLKNHFTWAWFLSWCWR